VDVLAIFIPLLSATQDMNIKQATCSIAALTAIASSAIAQQVAIPAHGSVYNGFSRGYSMVANIGFEIDKMELPLDAQQATDTASFLIQVNGVDVYTNFGGTSPIVSVIPPVLVIPGDTVLVVGNWSAAVTSNFSAHNSYGATAAPFATTVLGVAHQLDRGGYQCDIGDPPSYNGGTAAGGAASFTGITGSIGRVWIDAVSPGSGGGGGAIALAESVGDGCTTAYASMYEQTTLDVWAASNTMGGIDYINSGAGYIVTAAAGTIVPVGTVDPLTVAIPGIADDSVNPAGTLGLEFSSNGFLALGPGNSNQWNPSAGLFLDQPAAMFTCWADFEPNTGGTINYEEAGTRALLTYTDVYAWGTTDLNTFQFDYDTATGNCSTYFGAMASATAHPMFVGYSPAGTSLNPGSIGIEAELAATGAIVLAGADIAPLTLAGVGRPVMDPAASVAYDCETTNIDAGALFHVGIIGLSNPGLPLSLIGFPAGCTLYAQGDVLVGPAVVAGGPGDLTWTVFGLPAANPAYNGAVFHVAAATLDLTLVSSTSRASNGVKLTLGDT
jgi:hypothetical protein